MRLPFDLGVSGVIFPGATNQELASFRIVPLRDSVAEHTHGFIPQVQN